jgi:putative membrane protein
MTSAREQTDMVATSVDIKRGLTRWFLGAGDEARISKAIQAAEKKTSGEIVAVVAAESDSYLWAPILAAALAALAVAAPLIFMTWMNVQWIYLIQIAVFAGLTLLLSTRPLRFALVPPGLKRERAHARAVEQFLVQNMHTTTGRTGVLIFVSVAERYAEILADAAVHAKVPQATWQGIVDQMTAEIAVGRTGDGFVHAIEAVGKILGQHFPPGSADLTELPNHLIVLA